MMQRTRSLVVRRGVIALYAIAMLLLGFAHRPVALAVPAFDRAAYMLPDGSVADPCLSAPDHAPHAPADHAGRCEACTLVAASGLPPAPGVLPLSAAVFAVMPVPRPAETVARLPIDRAVARGPPLSRSMPA